MVASHLCEIQNFVAEEAFTCLMISHHNYKAYFISWVSLEQIQCLVGDKGVVRMLSMGDEFNELSLLGTHHGGQFGSTVDAERTLDIW